MRLAVLSCLLWLCACVAGDGRPIAESESATTVCDDDGDGYSAESCGGADCNDGDPELYPDHGCEYIPAGCNFPGCGDPDKRPPDAGAEVVR